MTDEAQNPPHGKDKPLLPATPTSAAIIGIPLASILAVVGWAGQKILVLDEDMQRQDQTITTYEPRLRSLEEIAAPAIDRIPGRVAQPKPDVSREIPPFTTEAATAPTDMSFFMTMDAGTLLQWMVDNLWGGDQSVLDRMPISDPWTIEELMNAVLSHYGWA